MYGYNKRKSPIIAGGCGKKGKNKKVIVCLNRCIDPLLCLHLIIMEENPSEMEIEKAH